jgi:hypothetical protein
MEMFQVGDHLGFGFKAADKVGVVGVFRQDDLNGYISIYGGLVGAIDRAKPTVTDQPSQFVALENLTSEVFKVRIRHGSM